MTAITTTLSLPQDEKAAAKARCDALSAEAKANWHDPQWRMAMTQALTAAVYEGFVTENILDLLSVVERVGETDRIFVKEVRGLRAFWTARGGYIEASNLRTDVAELQRDMIGFHVYEFEDKLRNGFGETQATLINLGQQRLEAELNRRVLSVFQAAIGVGSPSLVQVNGLNLAALDAAIDAVMDATLDEQVNIIGRRTMIGQLVSLLTSSGNYSMFMPNVNEDLLRRGVVGQYKGATVTTVKNYRDDEDIPFWPANELFVVGRDASKFGFWGGPLSMQWTDHNWYWNYQTRQDFGGGVFYPNRIRRVVDNNLAA